MTGRLPFDPTKMRGAREAAVPGGGAAASGGAAGAGGAMSVSALAALVSGALERLERPVRVAGEVSGFRERTHWYFDLKDADAVINCVMFASAARKTGLNLQNGQSVVATGRVEFYAKGGKVSLLCERLEAVGAGALEAAFRRLVEEIRGLGWFDPARKRRLPVFPRRVAVVTSRTGAALQDVIDTARRRCPGVEIAVVDVRVQGDRAAGEVAAAIDWLGAQRARLGIDVVLVTRGGGSMEDLWAFNEKVVARAIVECPVPVVAAIGHETDTTIAELVADERCATPTQAAMRIFPDGAALLEQVEAARSRLGFSVGRLVEGQRRRAAQESRALTGSARMRLERARVRVERLGGRLEQHRPAAAQARREARVVEAARRLRAAMRGALAAADVVEVEGRLRGAMARSVRGGAERVAGVERTLGAVSPLRVLARGYSVTTREDGRVVRSATDVRAGEGLVTRVAEGEVRSTVDGGGGARREGADVERPARAAPAGRPRRGREDEGGLFG